MKREIGIFLSIVLLIVLGLVRSFVQHKIDDNDWQKKSEEIMTTHVGGDKEDIMSDYKTLNIINEKRVYLTYTNEDMSTGTIVVDFISHKAYLGIQEYELSNDKESELNQKISSYKYGICEFEGNDSIPATDKPVIYEMKIEENDGNGNVEVEDYFSTTAEPEGWKEFVTEILTIIQA